jgi:hypothetical protein
VTGTVPIYWGCPSIGDFFDTNGMIIFDNVEELVDIINNLSIDGYIKRLESIKNNFNKSKKYLLPDDIIYKKLTLEI